VVKILLHRQKRLLSFQNSHLCLMTNNQLNITKKHSGLMNETFWTHDYACHGVAKTGDKQVLNRIRN